jgi:hypothetical protein
MEWLIQELTPIDKVRRNVILLATLAYLASFFVIETDRMAFLGAGFSSDAIMFGLFHALVFYTGVLLVRARFHERLVREAADADQFDRIPRLDQARKELAQVGAFISGETKYHVMDPVTQQTIGRTYEESGEAEQLAAQRAKSVALRQIKDLTGVRTFRQQGRWLVVIGEFAFPILYGIFGAILLLKTQSFPMLWELHLR